MLLCLPGRRRRLSSPAAVARNRIGHWRSLEDPEDLLAEEVRDRQEATERIASDVNKIHECFTDIQSLVSQQSEAVTLIEGDIENAHSSTENGMHQIEKAARHQRQGFRCCVMALATLALTMALIAVAIVLYKKLQNYARSLVERDTRSKSIRSL